MKSKKSDEIFPGNFLETKAMTQKNIIWYAAHYGNPAKIMPRLSFYSGLPHYTQALENPQGPQMNLPAINL